MISNNENNRGDNAAADVGTIEARTFAVGASWAETEESATFRNQNPGKEYKVFDDFINELWLQQLREYPALNKGTFKIARRDGTRLVLHCAGHKDCTFGIRVTKKADSQTAKVSRACLEHSCQRVQSEDLDTREVPPEEATTGRKRRPKGKISGVEKRRSEKGERNEHENIDENEDNNMGNEIDVDMGVIESRTFAVGASWAETEESAAFRNQNPGKEYKVFDDFVNELWLQQRREYPALNKGTFRIAKRDSTRLVLHCAVHKDCTFGIRVTKKADSQTAKVSRACLEHSCQRVQSEDLDAREVPPEEATSGRKRRPKGKISGIGKRKSEKRGRNEHENIEENEDNNIGNEIDVDMGVIESRTFSVGASWGETDEAAAFRHQNAVDDDEDFDDGRYDG